MWYLVITLLFALVVTVFALQNSTPVDVRFISWQLPQVSLAVVILSSAALGALFTLGLALIKQVRLSMKLWDSQGRFERLQVENKVLREENNTLRKQIDQLKSSSSS